MTNTNRVEDIRLYSETGEAGKLAVIDRGSGALFGIDVHVAGARVSLGVTINYEDLTTIRDMLNTIIYRNAAELEG